MKEVTKEEFKKVFLKYGKTSDGWGQDYWYKCYEVPKRSNLIYLVQLPSNSNETRMMIVDDYSEK